MLFLSSLRCLLLVKRLIFSLVTLVDAVQRQESFLLRGFITITSIPFYYYL
jgi:hypothetical protein